MAAFIKVPTFDIYDEEKKLWAGKEKWWLEGEMIYQSDFTNDSGAHLVVTVPNRFETDLASIPRIARILIPKNDRHRAPAVVHDFLCETWTLKDRSLADKIFREAMIVVGVGKIRRTLMYAAVRSLTALKQLGGKKK